MTQELWNPLIAALRQAEEGGGAQHTEQALEPIARASDDQLATLLESLLPQVPAGGRGADELLERVFSAVAVRVAAPARGKREMSDPLLQHVLALEQQLRPTDRSRAMLLRVLAASDGERPLKAFAERLVADPVGDATAAVTALGPLFRQDNLAWPALFPKLLEAIEHPATAVVALDFMNFLKRNWLAKRHPAYEHRQQLMTLLGEVTQRLVTLEENPPRDADEARQVGQQVLESVSLVVALIDALALIGDPEAVGKLYQAVELKHRRIRTEAAAALVALGEREAGVGHLKELAAFPISRLRAVGYAEEHDVLDEIPETHRQPSALAEADLVCWLADPKQFGMPPEKCELVDTRTQYWPGYDEPVDCCLFRFEYPFDEPYSNIGLTGPVTFAFSADIADLSIDDIYAAFAGWSAEHEEIYEVRAERLEGKLLRESERLERYLSNEGFRVTEPQRLGCFFGDFVLITEAERQGEQGIAITDGDETQWYPAGRGARPIGAVEGFSIYKGRKLLRAFNP